MMQHHPPLHHHKPSLSQSSMELVLSPSYASAANSSLTGSTASASAASISASTTGSGGMVEGGASSSPTNNDNKDNVASRASHVGGSIPHLLSTDCDNDSDDDGDDNGNGNDDDDEEAYLIHHIGSGHEEEGFIATSTRSNSFRYTHRNFYRSRNGSKANDDNGKFQSMLLEQQHQADEPCCPDDSVIYHSQGEDDAATYYTYPTQTVSLPPPSCSSPPLEDDVESSISLLHTKEERSNYNHHHCDRDPWTSTGKNLLSKFSRSAAKSISNSARHPQEVIQPITMMIDLDDNDEDLPWMLSQPGLGKAGAAMNRGGSVHDSESGEEDGQSSSPLQDDDDD